VGGKKEEKGEGQQSKAECTHQQKVQADAHANDGVASMHA
jgi:hypothetical protein